MFYCIPILIYLNTTAVFLEPFNTGLCMSRKKLILLVICKRVAPSTGKNAR